MPPVTATRARHAGRSMLRPYISLSMDIASVVVTLAGIAAAAWVVWYFWLYEDDERV